MSARGAQQFYFLKHNIDSCTNSKYPKLISDSFRVSLKEEQLLHSSHFGSKQSWHKRKGKKKTNSGSQGQRNNVGNKMKVTLQMASFGLLLTAVIRKQSDSLWQHFPAGGGWSAAAAHQHCGRWAERGGHRQPGVWGVRGRSGRTQKVYFLESGGGQREAVAMVLQLCKNKME